MYNVKIALTILIAILLQFLLPKPLPFFRYVDLPLLITVYFSLQRAPQLGMWIGALAGIGGDVIAGGIPGVGGFAKTLIGYLIGLTSIKVALDNPFAKLGVVAAASATNTVFFIGLYLLLEQDLPQVSNWSQFGKTLGWSVLADTLAAIFVFYGLEKVFPKQPEIALRKRFYE